SRAMPTDHPKPARPGSPLTFVWGLFGISLVGLALGAFVLPNLLPASAGSIPPYFDPGPIQLGDTAPPAPVVAAAAPPATDAAVKPAAPPKPPGKPHPLDAAPQVVPQLPAGELFAITA